MKYMRNFLPVLLVFLLVSAIDARATPFFTDSFESGDLSKTSNGAKWHGIGKNVTVSSDRAHTGSRSLRYFFPASPKGNSWAEQRFSLGSRKDEVYIRFYIYFPTNYVHQNIQPNNNKLIRLWSENSRYGSDPIVMGASTVSSGPSRVIPELPKVYQSGQWVAACNGGMGDVHKLPGMGSWELKPSDLGRWMSFEFHFRRDTGKGDGALQFWVDGQKKFGTTNLKMIGAPCSPGYFLTGYLLGWANSGFPKDTYIYIDDVAFSDKYIGPISASSPAPPPPVVEDPPPPVVEEPPADDPAEPEPNDDVDEDRQPAPPKNLRRSK